jgi:hypothetical protein
MAGCASGDVEKKRPASLFNATMVTLEPVIEEDDQPDEDHLLAIIQFDDDGDAIMTDAWELDEISSTIPDDEKERLNGIFDFSLISEDDLALDDVVVPPAGDAATVPSMDVSSASAVPDSVQIVAALVPATLLEPTPVTAVASVTTTGRPHSAPIVAAVPPTPTAIMSGPSVPVVPADPVAMAVPDYIQSGVAALVPATLPEFPIITAAVPPPVPTAMSAPSVPSTAVPFAMLPVPPDDSIHLVVSPIRIYPFEVRTNGVPSTGRVSAPPSLRRSARLAAKNAMRNSVGTIFINGRRRSARLASPAL